MIFIIGAHSQNQLYLIFYTLLFTQENLCRPFCLIYIFFTLICVSVMSLGIVPQFADFAQIWTGHLLSKNSRIFGPKKFYLSFIRLFYLFYFSFPFYLNKSLIWDFDYQRLRSIENFSQKCVFDVKKKYAIRHTGTYTDL